MKSTVTIFADNRGVVMKAQGMTMPEVEQMIREAKSKHLKNDLPLLKFAKFGDRRSELQSLRHDPNVLQVTGIEGDCDDDKTPMQDAVDRLRAAGVEALFYTTASHMVGGKGRWRVLCLLKLPLDGTTDELKASRRHWVGVLNAYLGGVLQAESFKLSPAYYFGPLDGKAKPTIVMVPGQRIDEAANPPLPLYPPDQIPKIRTEKALVGGNGEDHLPLTRSQVVTLLELISPDDYHDWIKVGQVLKSWNADEGFALWVSWSKTSKRIFKREPEFEKKWDTFHGSGLTIGTLVHMAGGKVPKPSPEEEGFTKVEPKSNKKKASLIVENAGDLEEMAIEWIVPQYFPRGMLSAIAGYGGEGKSIILTSIMAALSQGKNFINGQPLSKPISMLIITEEAFQQLTLPRLNFNGADTSRIGRIRGVSKPKGDDESWNLVEHIKQVREYLIQHPEVELLIIDPIGNYMSGKSRSTDNTQDGEVRNVLRPWQELAEELNVSILYLAHFNKSKTTHIHEKVTGSSAFVTSTRITFGVGKMAPERVEELGLPPILPSKGSYRVLFPIKGNIGILPPPLLFKFELVEGTIVPRVTVEMVLPHGYEIALAEDVLTKGQKASSDSKGPTTADRVLAELETRPGMIQQDLALALSVDKSNLRPVLQRLENDGKIVRIKGPRGNQVYLSGDVALFS